ncbi:UDP-2,3-diacylglucosamine diphosphatase [Lewinella sp. 4G2]|uniref:UDP-2,3-diacylglucosamine diphosphatase n=1 Tax=Lewinella sp. 4G2 TaxID=1803372 RepID=UPI0007B4F399|nr:UDP-2,3-diacylglucosamine diphosphatase [Lewinella sp. 4G2]OAV43020.1 UDP-2,3-diacylglucosamine hydrolase [Lewinella sp. 4G2]
MAIYFASDFHLGVDARVSSRERERQIVAWLDHCWRTDAEAFYLVGDLFEFWFEWKEVVPKGYVRFLGKLAEIVDSGCPVHVFTGNHDLWMVDYLEREVGVKLHFSALRVQLKGYEVLIAHGDGLGPGDHGYKRMKKVFTAGWAKWLYARLHPNFAIRLAFFLSGRSRSSQPAETEFLGPDQEWLVAYSERKLAQDASLDFCLFGHRHLPIDHTLSNGRSRYLNLGEWLHYNSYCRLDEGGVELLYWK